MHKGMQMDINQHETVTISLEEYNDLLDDKIFLLALQNAGVDNWSGYDYAKEIYQDIKNISKISIHSR